MNEGKKRQSTPPRRKRASRKATPPKRKGPPPLRATLNQLLIITRGAARGSTERGIYLRLGISAPTWFKWKYNDPRVQTALDRGFEQMHDKLVGKLLDKAEKGDTISLIYATKALIGLRDSDPPAQMQPQVIVHLPGAAASPTEFGRLIEARPTDEPAPLALPMPEGMKRG